MPRRRYGAPKRIRIPLPESLRVDGLRPENVLTADELTANIIEREGHADEDWLDYAIGQGARLNQLHALFSKAGKWSRWLKLKLKWSRQQAARLMRIADMVDVKDVRIEALRDRDEKERHNLLHKLGRSTLYELGAPSLPDTIRNRIFDKVAAGTNVTLKEVRRIIKHDRIDNTPTRRGQMTGTEKFTVGLNIDAAVWYLSMFALDDFEEITKQARIAIEQEHEALMSRGRQHRAQRAASDEQDGHPEDDDGPKMRKLIRNGGTFYISTPETTRERLARKLVEAASPEQLGEQEETDTSPLVWTIRTGTDDPKPDDEQPDDEKPGTTKRAVLMPQLPWLGAGRPPPPH